MRCCPCRVMQQQILDANGFEGRSAWAFGLGLERLAMVLFADPGHPPVLDERPALPEAVPRGRPARASSSPTAGTRPASRRAAASCCLAAATTCHTKCNEGFTSEFRGVSLWMSHLGACTWGCVPGAYLLHCE